MKADDPRHGKRTGYKAGCREECCRRPHRAALKLYRMGRAPKIIDATGTRRRIEAMFASGWTAQEVATAAGRTSRTWAHEVRKETRVVETTAIAIVGAFNTLVDPPEGRYRSRQRTLAARSGCLPREMWWDIDDPDETPDPGYSSDRSHDELDPVVVDRVLAGDWPLAASASKAERVEIVARWTGSLNELERLTKWNVARYVRGSAA